MRNLQLTFILQLSLLPLLAEDASKFANVHLPLGVSIKVPKNWHLLDGDINLTIETAGEAVTKLADLPLPSGKKINLFRANSNPPSTYCGIAINATDSDTEPSEVFKTSPEEIAQFTPSVKATVEKGLSVEGLRILSFSSVKRELVDGHPALAFEYKRTGPMGEVVVQVTRLFIGVKEISLNLSYRESEAMIWAPIVRYMRSTFRVASNEQQLRTNNDMIHYQDEKYPFSAWDPKTWTKVPTTQTQTRLKAVSRNGEGQDDFNIVVYYNEQAKMLTPAEYVAKISNPNSYLRMIQQTIPGAKLIDHGKTKLSSQEAYYFTSDVTHKSVGVSVPIRQMQVFMAQKGYQYTITCRTGPEDFDKAMPTFQLIMAGFFLRPTQH